ncbi:MAG: hypothetical protein DRJ65_15350 [Acidobacteria bacterium]|nr:MAG: hypothetical protein DRJ65_15350 [Acidobacteriota bacterium]
MVAIGLSFILLSVFFFVVDSETTELQRVASGAAGAALLVFAQTESVAWKKPLTLGHQLVMWWYWPLVLPVFLVITRNRRSTKITVAITGVIGAIYLATAVFFFTDLARLVY